MYDDVTYDVTYVYDDVTQDDELPPMSIVPDIDDPFVPTPHCVVNLHEHAARLKRVLNALPALYANTQV